MTLTPLETYEEWRKFFDSGETTLPYKKWMEWNGLGTNGERIEGSAYETA